MKRICVFCGSSLGARPVYAAAARALGSLLAARGIGLVYGGAKVGLMGSLADAAIAAGGKVIGVMPELLVRKEVAHGGLKELHVVKSMHERKAMMADLSDGFIALPGGFGTFEEFCEVLTWAQLGLHSKPCGILNVGGYFDSLLQLFDQSVAEEFLRPAHRAMVVAEEEPGTLVDRLMRHQPPLTPKWISSDAT
ncbi:MAG: TIGR00730 family Rossman fold protein [Bryobacteraceae bacterium]